MTDREVALLINSLCYLAIMAGTIYALFQKKASDKVTIHIVNVIFAIIAVITIRKENATFVDLFWIMGVLLAIMLSLTSSAKSKVRLAGFIPGSTLIYLGMRIIPIVKYAMKGGYYQSLSGYLLIIIFMIIPLAFALLSSVFSRYQTQAAQ